MKNTKSKIVGIAMAMLMAVSSIACVGASAATTTADDTTTAISQTSADSSKINFEKSGYMYIDITGCSWYQNDGCVPFLTMKNEDGTTLAEKALKISDGQYKAFVPCGTYSDAKVSRMDKDGNEFNQVSNINLVKNTNTLKISADNLANLTVETATRVYFSDSKNWSNYGNNAIRMHSWKQGGAESENWQYSPKMTYMGKNLYNESVFYADLSTDFDSVIFWAENNGSTVAQTNDITLNGTFLAFYVGNDNNAIACSIPTYVK